MEYNPASKFNELSGNVEVIYQSYVINSDRLKIYFFETATITKKDTDKKDEGAKIEKIVATGNVKIKFDNRVATSEKAEYFIKTEDLILSGKDTRIEFDGNSFVGTRVTFNRVTQKMSMEGSKDTQLKGIIISFFIIDLFEKLSDHE